jgi:hypothetical protein
MPYRACEVDASEASVPGTDIRRRPAEKIKGSRGVWSAVALVNFMGIGPIAYFLFGRKRASPDSSSPPSIPRV